MKFQGTLPKDGEIQLTGLSESEFYTFTEIMQVYVAQSRLFHHPVAAVSLAHNILAGLGVEPREV